MIDSHWHKDMFHLYWADESRTILILEFVNNFKWADYYALMDVVHEMVDSITYPVVYINMWHSGVKIPLDSPLTHFSNMRKMFVPQAAIVVMQSSWQRPFFEMLALTIGFRKNETYWMVETYDEALTLAEETSHKLLKVHSPQ